MFDHRQSEPLAPVGGVDAHPLEPRLVVGESEALTAAHGSAVAVGDDRPLVGAVAFDPRREHVWDVIDRLGPVLPDLAGEGGDGVGVLWAGLPDGHVQTASTGQRSKKLQRPQSHGVDRC